MYDQTSSCKKCNSSRAQDLRIPCGACGARSTMFGYLYDHEYKNLLWGVIIVSVFICLACVAGAIFLTLQSTLLIN